MRDPGNEVASNFAGVMELSSSTFLRIWPNTYKTSLNIPGPGCSKPTGLARIFNSVL